MNEKDDAKSMMKVRERREVNNNARCVWGRRAYDQKCGGEMFL